MERGFASQFKCWIFLSRGLFFLRHLQSEHRVTERYAFSVNTVYHDSLFDMQEMRRETERMPLDGLELHGDVEIT